MPLKVLNDNVLIKQDQDEFMDQNPEIVRILKEGKITLPEKYETALKKVASTGTIVSWGSRCQYEHKKGDKIYFKPFSGINIQFKTETYRVISEWDLLGKTE